MQPTEGRLGSLPCLAFGTGPPLVAVGGLSPTAGVSTREARRMATGLFAPLAAEHRVWFVNRRPRLPQGMSMSELAAEHADGIRNEIGQAVDVLGVSTGGSIAQQLAADHPDVVRRLVLVSSACRLGPEGRGLQRRVAARIRRGASRQAVAVMMTALAPQGLRRVAIGVAVWILAPWVLPSPGDLADLATTIEAEDGFDLARCHSAIRAPTLIIAGAKDRFYSPELFKETAALIPDSRLALLEDRGHMTVTRDHGFAPQISHFLSSS